MNNKITSFEMKIPVNVPGTDGQTFAEVKSDVYEGITFTIPVGTRMYELHEQLLAGLVQEMQFQYTPSEKG